MKFLFTFLVGLLLVITGSVDESYADQPFRETPCVLEVCNISVQCKWRESQWACFCCHPDEDEDQNITLKVCRSPLGPFPNCNR